MIWNTILGAGSQVDQLDEVIDSLYQGRDDNGHVDKYQCDHYQKVPALFIVRLSRKQFHHGFPFLGLLAAMKRVGQLIIPPSSQGVRSSSTILIQLGMHCELYSCVGSEQKY